ncbi:histidine kinase [Streptomyces sp. NPDC006662]|uniref:sensor histidine kinase n=1 Tax=Streptomyces sp. NPDC006662 TaxID=3156902 RepID=UPI0033E68A24
MSKLTGWWKNRSSAGKVEVYTRWSFHFFVLVEIFSFGSMAFTVREPGSPKAPAVAVAAFLVVCAHAVLVGFLSSRALDGVTGRRERPVRLAVVTSVLTGVAVLFLLCLRRFAGLEAAAAPGMVIGVSCFGCGSLVLTLEKVRHMRYVPLGAAAGSAAAVAALGLPLDEVVGYFVGVLTVCAFLAFTCGFSGWLLRTVYELDRAREIQARLAVAEERLRFGRDLHDVMGRNLAVIALKSELAVQLARRERPEAVDQMIEVQRIARASQKEVRDVVRGYREADLSVELEGARGVLSAAGMDCRVELEAAARELPSEVQSALGWVVREATTNVLRHGDARSCLIRLTDREALGTLTLLVENDGVPEAPAGPPGSGLAGLRERLAAVDGSLHAGPAGSGRFRLRAEIPLHTRRTEVRA